MRMPRGVRLTAVTALVTGLAAAGTVVATTTTASAAGCNGSFSQIPGNGRALGQPAAVRHGGRLTVVVRGRNNRAYFTYYSLAAGDWYPRWRQVPGGALISNTPVVANYRDHRGQWLIVTARSTDGRVRQTYTSDVNRMWGYWAQTVRFHPVDDQTRVRFGARTYHVRTDPAGRILFACR